MKAVLLNSASTYVTHSDGMPWAQAAHAVPGTTVVTRSLDEELGAGMLDVEQALVQYEPQEVLPGANNGAANFNIHAENRLFFWDLEQVNGDGGMVNYLLGPVSDQHVRITLTWDVDATGGGGLMPLELRLYREDDPDLPGFDPADLLIIETSKVGENVKMFDMTIPDPDLGDNPEVYVQVINTGATVTKFGLAAAVPEPASICLLALGGLVALRRRR
jgi:hypothetical protein